MNFCCLCFIQVKVSLDYEQESRYAFDVKAWYEMIPTLSSTVRVEVQVNDQNDHSPVFKEKSFNRQIDENVRSGTFFLLAHADDFDGSRENSMITYRLIADPGLPFSIGSQSGEVRVDGSIDHEVQSYYHFQIEARDNGSPPFSSRVQVNVNITDLNDNAPIISDYNASIIVQERKAVGSNLITLTIRDLDSAVNGAPFDCSLQKGDETKFSVASMDDGAKCVVKSKSTFDKTQQDEYQIEVRVTDSGMRL